MAFLSKYGVARHIYIPIVKRAVVDHAVGADWTPAAGDVKISKDGGAAANVTNLPTAIAMGNSALWDFSITATEMQAAQVVVTVADSATKAVEDTAFIIETYGNASGQHAVDLSDSVRAGLTALPNATAGASTGLIINGSNSGTVTLAALTVTGTLTISDGMLISRSTGNSSAVVLTGTGTGHGLSLVAGATGNGLKIATTAGDGVSIAPTAGHGINIAANGTSKHGIFVTGGTAGTSDGMSLVAGTGGVALRAATITGDITGNLNGTVSVLTTYTGNTPQTGDAFARLGAPSGASVSADIAQVYGKVDTEVADIQARLPAALTSGGNMKADIIAINGVTGSATKLDRAVNSEVLGTCTSGGTTTSIPVSSLSPASSVADQFVGLVMKFASDTTTAALRGQGTSITAFNHGTQTFTVVALTTAPATGDIFVIG